MTFSRDLKGIQVAGFRTLQAQLNIPPILNCRRNKGDFFDFVRLKLPSDLESKFTVPRLRPLGRVRLWLKFPNLDPEYAARDTT